MRVSKPAPSTRGRSSGEVIAELENLKIVVQAQVESLALERELLRAQSAALEAVAAALGDLITATQPLRAARARESAADGREPAAAAGGCACGAGDAGDGVLQRWAGLRDEWRRLKGARCASVGASVASRHTLGSREPAASGAGGAGGGGGGGGVGTGLWDSTEWRSGPAASGRPGSGGSGADGGAGAGPGRGGCGAEGCACGEAPWWASYMDLGGSPEAALTRCRSLGPADVAERVLRFARAASVDLVRLRAGADDDAESRARLAAGLGGMMALSAELLACNPRALGEVAVYRLDTLQPAPDTAPEPRHWAFAMEQAGLSRPQELAFVGLMDLYKARLAELLQAREGLLARQAACAGDAAESAELLVELERFQEEYSYTVMGFSNALYSHTLRPDQALSIFVCSLPYIPQLLVLDQAMRDVAAQRLQREQDKQQQRQQQQRQQQQQQLLPERQQRQQRQEDEDEEQENPSASDPKPSRRRGRPPRARAAKDMAWMP